MSSQCCFNVTVTAGNKCPLSQGYWKSHAALWSASATPMTLGSKTYSKPELITLMNTATMTDASVILARQLIAAILNTANGANPGPICTAIAQAQTLLSGFSGKLPYSVKVSTPIGKQMVSLANTLEKYNLGALTTGCTP